MEAVEGHSTVSPPVTFRHKNALQRQRLASNNAADDEPVSTKRHVSTGNPVEMNFLTMCTTLVSRLSLLLCLDVAV